MRHRTQGVAYAYFVVALLLYGLQMVFGLLAISKYLGPDPISDWLPFDRVKEIHTNLLIVWVLTGFMGATYWVVPEESRAELYSPKTRLLVARPLDARGRHGRGRLSLRLDRGEQAPRAALPGEARDRRGDAAVPAQHRDDDPAGRAAHDHDGGVLVAGLALAALLYLPALLTYDNYTLSIFYRWWTVHLWVEGVWEMVQGALLAYLLIRLSGVDREVWRSGSTSSSV